MLRALGRHPCLACKRRGKKYQRKKDNILYLSKSVHIYDVGDDIDVVFAKFQDCNFIEDIPDLGKNPKISLQISR